MTQLSQYLLDPDIDLTSEETQWRDVELWYRQVCFDEFQFTDRLRFFAVKWLLENRKRPVLSNRWHWFRDTDNFSKNSAHSKIFSGGFDFAPEYEAYCQGHILFGDSILFFTSLWPRFYVECVLPTQENEPANAEEFWENLGLSVPGEDWQSVCEPKKFLGRWLDDGKYTNQKPFKEADKDPHYRWTYGNAVIRAVKAWRGESE